MNTLKLFSFFKNIVPYVQGNQLKVSLVLFLVLWTLMHISGFLYGTNDVPLHITYVGDEQVSVNSALRVLNEKSIFAFRNREMQYYGPMFVIMDTPGVAFDFAWKYVTGVVRTAEDYKHYIIWDWGGIIRNIRATAILSMLLGLIVVYKIASTSSYNVSRNKYIPYMTVVLVAVNYLYFEYSHFAIHWTYVLPLLFAQWYTLILIVESKGNKFWFWFWHGLAVVVSFGVSNVSLIYLSMWWPALYTMLRERDLALFKKYILAMLGTATGCVLMVAWHPYAFFRNLSFIGIGEPMHNQGDAQNPFVLINPSWEPYLTEIFIISGTIIFALAILQFVLRRTPSWHASILWMFLFPGIVNFFLFAPAEHYEGRYALPTILSILLSFGYVLSVYLSDTKVQSRIATISVATLLMSYVAFNFVHDVLWMHIFSKGPIEQGAIQMALELQESGSPVLIINSYLFGYPHTKDSYRAFSEHRGFGDIPLYKEIYANPLPQDKVLLNARYMFLKTYIENPRVLQEYAHVIFLFRPRQGDWNQFSFFDENPLRNWYYKELSDRYITIK
jgi:hypothetical protein